MAIVLEEKSHVHHLESTGAELAGHCIYRVPRCTCSELRSINWGFTPTPCHFDSSAY